MQQILSGSDVRITKLLISETGTYNPQYRRPFETSVTGDVIDALQERVSGSGTVAASQLAGVAFSFLAPSAQPEKQVNIVNGWAEKRLRFMMEVETVNNMGMVNTQILLGYTDHPGISLTGAIDPNMMFYINSTISIKQEVNNLGFGAQNFSISGEASHVIADNDWAGVYTDQKDFRMRPTDVFSVMTRTHVGGSLGGQFVDTRNMISTTPSKSRRSNSLASTFAANIINTYSQAVSTDDFHQSEDAILANARGACVEAPVAHDKFMRALANMRGQPATNWFTYRELQRISPSVDSDEVTVVVITGDAISKPNTQHQAGMTDDWGQAHMETKVATILSQAVPALMMESGLMKLAFSATNKTVNGLMEYSIGGVATFNTNMNAVPLMNRFFQELEIKVMRDVSENSAFTYQITLDVNLVGDTTISIQLEGRPWTSYNVPSFCDALLVPVITANDQRATMLASDFQKIFASTINSKNVHQEVNNPSLPGNGIYGLI